MSSTNGQCGCGQDFGKLVESVKRIEDMLEGLFEAMNENHAETLETIQDIADRGDGFGTVTFES